MVMVLVTKIIDSNKVEVENEFGFEEIYDKRS